MKPIVGQLYTLRYTSKHKIAKSHIIDLFHPEDGSWAGYEEGTPLIYISKYSTDPKYDITGGWHTVYLQEYGLREVYSSAANKEIEFIPCK